MATGKDPAERVKEAAAAAMSDTLNKSTFDLLMNVQPEDVVEPSPKAELVKGNAHRSVGWLHGPAHLEMLATADGRLTRLAELQGMSLSKVERVKAKLIKGTKLVIIQPAPASDLSAFPVTRFKGKGCWINLITLLNPEGFGVETGYKERFDIAYVPKGSPMWPGLVIDLGDPKERRQHSTKKASAAKKGAPAQDASAPTGAPADAATAKKSAPAPDAAAKGPQATAQQTNPDATQTPSK